MIQAIDVSASHFPSVGSQAVDFTLLSLSGETNKLSELNGKPGLINFWATWCAPCLLEMPNIQKLYEKYPGQFEVLAVNAGESERTVQKFVDAVGLTFSILLDVDGEVQQQYRIKGYPTTYFLDKDGIIRFQHIGMLTEAQLTEYLGMLGVGE
jgi:thiol-disulfide isomerase/thioredoxin